MNQTSPSLTGTILLLPRSLAEDGRDVGGKVPRRRFSGIPIAPQGRSLLTEYVLSKPFRLRRSI